MLMLLLSAMLQGLEAPQFHIEKIRIEGAAFISHDVIIAESNLSIDRSYSEKELRYAIHRINRLPFVLETQFSFEKGSEKGKYHLIIKVKPAARLFFNLETSRTRDLYQSTWMDDLSLGYRWSIGSSGQMFVAASPGLSWLQDIDSAETLTFGYSQYNLFDKNIFFNITVNWVNDTIFESSYAGDTLLFSSFKSPIAPELSLFAPLKGNHWLKFQATKLETFSSGKISFLPGETSRFEALTDTFQTHLYWEYNTLNDNFLPSSGSLIQGGWYYVTRNQFNKSNFNPGILSNNLNEKLNIWSTTYKRYRKITSRQSWNYGTELGYGIHHIRGTSLSPNGDLDSLALDENHFFYDLELGYAADLLGRKLTAKLGDLRLETHVLTSTRKYPNVFREEREKIGINASITFRNKWGLIRVGYNYRGEKL